MFTLGFWKSAVERMVRAAAAAVLSVVGGNLTDVLAVDVKGLLSVAAGAALVSLLISLVSSAVTGGPGLTETPNAKVVALKTADKGVVAGEASPVPNGESVKVQAV
jgi:hypothetical protein